jgi:hypothetical protein
MMTPRILKQAGTLVVVLQLVTGGALAHTAVEEMADAANHFLAALSPEQRAKATFEFKSDERQNWHFIPKQRNGLPFKELAPAQNKLAQALLASGMSARGYIKATTIMSLEQVLKDMEKGSGPTRDPDLYFVSVFGKPGEKATWGWRVEGHHLAINFTIVNGEHISATPSFMGSNPAEIKEGARRGLRVLADEELVARELVKSLDGAQRKLAVFADTAPKDIITSAVRKAKPLEEVGLISAKMTSGQRELLQKLIKEYLYRHRSEIADRDLAKIDTAGLDRIYFAWAGGLEPGQGHYYRVQGPSFLLEYDNVQNNNNHIHAVWRDFESDFGEDLLRKHYEQVKHD